MCNKRTVIIMAKEGVSNIKNNYNIIAPTQTFILSDIFVDKTEEDILPRQISIFEGKPAKFTCKSITPAIWKFENGPLPNNAVVGRNEELKESWIAMQDAHMENAGSYSCAGITVDELSFNYTGLLVIIPSSLRNGTIAFIL